MFQINGKEYNAEDIQNLKAMAQAMGFSEKNDPASLNRVATPLYGPYQDGSNIAGVLSIPGIRPEMYSAMLRPRSLARFIGVRKSVYTNEKIGIITGATDGSGTNPTNYCGDPVSAGQLKRCVQNYLFGKWFMKTKLNVLPETGQRVDRSDVDKKIMNLTASPNPFIPDAMNGVNLNNPMGIQLANELLNVGISLERTLEAVIIQGDKTQANTATEHGWIKEFDGLERQIITGRTDLDSGLACAAADSTVISWNAAIDATSGGRTWAQMVVDTVWFLRDLASQLSLNVQFGIVMPARMFRAATYVWACQYYTERCAGSAGNPVMAGAMEITAIRQAMMDGRYLIVDGENVPVIFSDGITVNRITASTFYADMFVVPLSVDGVPVLNFEYFPMDNADISAFDGFAGLNTVASINNGMYLVGQRNNGFCKEYLFAMMGRLILDLPFLAARIDDTTFTYAAPNRSALPSDTTSYVDGGASSFDGTFSQF